MDSNTSILSYYTYIRNSSIALTQFKLHAQYLDIKSNAQRYDIKTHAQYLDIVTCAALRYEIAYSALSY